MATLAPSLRRLFDELDDVWPNRDRRTDGWYRDCKWVDHGTDHCPDTSGRVHAIDIDKDGIDPDFVVSKLIRMNDVVRYVIWNRHIWEHKNGWRKDDYHGTSNPHTDHIHVSIEHTDKARGWSGGFGLSVGLDDVIDDIVNAVVAMPKWDGSGYLDTTSSHFLALRGELDGLSLILKGMRK